MRARLLLCLAFVAMPTPLLARDYGQQGTHFPIIELDLLEQIKLRLHAMEASGEINRLNNKLKARTIARVNRPTPVAGIVRAEKTRSWQYDPTITLATDIFDDKGRRIWAKGTRVNPLDTVPLRQKLIFIDGDDPAQLKWAMNDNAASKAKLILVRGAPLKLMKARQKRFYFDQGGKLTEHFGIKAVPAMVDQQGRVLRVREVALPPRKGSIQ
ncbi:type-F conjugative transfer system protein TraW [Parasphingorhabdus sp.]|uniref:type-F conjugative transfer system protein TraW n=1 Tax=Parasphingorhabdus sp. TaxID=2709688 RepID=UPI003BB0C6AD